MIKAVRSVGEMKLFLLLLLPAPARDLGGQGGGVTILVSCDCEASLQVFTFQVWMLGMLDVLLQQAGTHLYHEHQRGFSIQCGGCMLTQTGAQFILYS